MWRVRFIPALSLWYTDSERFYSSGPRASPGSANLRRTWDDRYVNLAPETLITTPTIRCSPPNPVSASDTPSYNRVKCPGKESTDWGNPKGPEEIGRETANGVLVASWRRSTGL